MALEDFAFALNIKLDLLEVLLQFSNFSDHSHIDKHLDQLKVMHSFSSFCKVVNVNSDLMLYLLYFSFNKVEFKDLYHILQTMKADGIIDKEFFASIVAISRSRHIIRTLNKENASIHVPKLISTL